MISRDNGMLIGRSEEPRHSWAYARPGMLNMLNIHHSLVTSLV